mmetsp:Transcript_4885/g.13614  ORF Transcript_4885/g.13614 Transcript_4885/m.13614 type:complete len:215 (-) Transcript_4885:23-667(-)
MVLIVVVGNGHNHVRICLDDLLRFMPLVVNQQHVAGLIGWLALFWQVLGLIGRATLILPELCIIWSLLRALVPVCPDAGGFDRCITLRTGDARNALVVIAVGVVVIGPSEALADLLRHVGVVVRSLFEIVVLVHDLAGRFANMAPLRLALREAVGQARARQHRGLPEPAELPAHEGRFDELCGAHNCGQQCEDRVQHTENVNCPHVGVSRYMGG